MNDIDKKKDNREQQEKLINQISGISKLENVHRSTRKTTTLDSNINQILHHHHKKQSISHLTGFLGFSSQEVRLDTEESQGIKFWLTRSFSYSTKSSNILGQASASS